MDETSGEDQERIKMLETVARAKVTALERMAQTGFWTPEEVASRVREAMGAEGVPRDAMIRLENLLRQVEQGA